MPSLPVCLVAQGRLCGSRARSQDTSGTRKGEGAQQQKQQQQQGQKGGPGTREAPGSLERPTNRTAIDKNTTTCEAAAATRRRATGSWRGGKLFQGGGASRCGGGGSLDTMALTSGRDGMDCRDGIGRRGDVRWARRAQVGCQASPDGKEGTDGEGMDGRRPGDRAQGTEPRGPLLAPSSVPVAQGFRAVPYDWLPE